MPDLPHDKLFADAIVAQTPRLRAYARRLAHSPTDADDLVQDALARAWRARVSFQPGTHLQAWLFRILRNEFLNQLPRSRRYVSDADGQYAETLSAPPDQEARLQVRDVFAALPRLPAGQREALLMVVSGLSYEHAAAACACAPNVLKQRVHRARTTLAAIVDPPLPAAPRKLRSTAEGAEGATQAVGRSEPGSSMGC